MARHLDLPPEDVSLALLRLARNGGNIELTADELIDDRFQVPRDTLQTWMLDTHAEQYRRIEKELGERKEENAIARLRTIIEKTSALRVDMVDEVGRISDQRLLPQALRALSDAEAKSTTMLLQLTGRPVNGDRHGTSLGELAATMIAAGFIRPTEGITLEPPLQVENEADR